jgi:hypothetical protein
MGFIVKGVKSVVKAVVGVASKVVGKILGPIVGLFKGKKAKTSSNLRLDKDLTPETYRKIVFGHTAGGLDLRFWQVWGPNGTNYDEVLANACHRINAYKELYFEDELAIDANGVVQPKFVGVVSRNTRLGAFGQTAMAVGDGTQWDASCNFESVAHMRLAWVPTEKKLPNGVPTRYTQVLEGAVVYDPRRDSTVGGSGSHRINDRTTWDYAALDSHAVPIGRNNALQVLWYLLGWYVPNTDTGELVLVAGRGIAPEDINIATFITGANDCEAAGYYTDMILSTEDAHTSNEDKMTAGGLIAQLIDTGGLWSYYANVDDSANVSLYVTDADILDTGSVTWEEYKSISDQYQGVTGKFIDPSTNALYQLNGYPMVRDANYEQLSGLKQRRTQDFEVVQDIFLAQKLARLLLNMGQYQAEFAGPFLYRALKAQVWSIVSYTSDRFGWTKLFRVYRYDITGDSGIQMLLREIHPSIWGAGSVTQPRAPSAGQKYDPRQEIVATGIGWQHTTVTNGLGVVQDGVILFWDAPPPNARYTEARIRLEGEGFWQGASPSKGDAFVTIVPIVSGAAYEFQVRHISIHEVAGPWVPDPAQDFVAGTDSKLPWDYISDPAGTKPEDNATNGAPGDSPLGDTTAQAAVDKLRVNSNNILGEILRGNTLQGSLDARTFLNGVPIGTVVKQLQDQYNDGVSASASTLALIGAKNPDGEGFIINANGVYFGVDAQGNKRNLVSSLESLSSSVDGQTTTIDAVKSIVYGPNGAVDARAIFSIQNGNQVTGFYNTLTGKFSEMAFVTDKFSIIDPGGGSPFKPFVYEDGVFKMSNIEVDTIKAKSITIISIADGLSKSPRYTSGDIAIPANEVTVIETPFFSVSDGTGVGNGTATFNCTHDGTGTKDTSARFRVYVDTGGGYGVPSRISLVGAQVTGGDIRFSIPVSMAIAFTTQLQARIKITAQGNSLGGGPTSGSYARDISIDIMTLGR